MGAYIADCVLGDINAVLEKSFCSVLSWDGCRAVADLARIGLHDEGFVEVEHFFVLEAVVVVVFVVPFSPCWHCDRRGGKEGEEGCGGEVHFRR